MKKRVLILMLALVLCLTLAFAACQQHKCQSVCPECGKCTNKDCTDPACADKCAGHTPQPHVCQHVCPECGKCTNKDCTDPVCAEKCAGHQTAVLVEKILVNTDDETHEGTVESPLDVPVAQSNSVEVTFTVLPQDATNKTINWTVGKITDGAFAAASDTGVTATATGSKLTISASATAVGNIAIEGKAADDSAASVYLNVVVESFVAVSNITSGALVTSEEEGVDYQLTTAMGVNWNMDAGMAPRGEELLAGSIFGGLQKPVNLTYFAGAYNLKLDVAPADATDKSLVISYSVPNVVEVNEAGDIEIKGAGSTVVTIASYTNPDVKIAVKVTVLESLYRGITQEAYNAATTSERSSWDLDPNDSQKGGAEHMACYGEWNLVMVHSNLNKGEVGIDNNQKIFYMGSADKPYGVSLENNVGATSGGSLLDSASLMWAKLTIPQNALTFNVKLNNNDKTHGQYRVVFVSEDGKATVLTNNWEAFATPNMPSFTKKLEIPAALKGQTGAMVIEHRVTEFDNNAELHVYKMSFEGQIDVTGVVFDKTEETYQVGEREFTVHAVVKPDNATNDKVVYSMKDGSADGVTVDAASGKVTVSATAVAGEYVIVATAEADSTKTAEFTLTLVDDVVEILTWENKGEILDESRDPWTVNGDWDSGVGEGVDLRHTGSYLSNEFVIKQNSSKLTFGVRVFVRGGETYPEIQLQVVQEGQDPVVIKARGQSSDTVTVISDDYLYFSYNLTQFIGQKVEIRIVVVNDATHCAIGSIKMEEQPENEPDVIEVKSISLNKDAETLTVGSENLTLQLIATIKPANATDTTVHFQMIETATGVSVDENGLITVTPQAQAGVYTIKVFAGNIEKMFTLTLTAEEVEVNAWNNKAELLDGVSGVKWEIVNGYNSGAGEGIDLSTRLDSGAGKDYSAAKLANRKIKASSFIMEMSIRTFPNEKTQEIVVTVELADGTRIVIPTIDGTKAIPDNNPANDGKVDTYRYDLSKYIGQTVHIELGVTGECYHAVITAVKFLGNEKDITTWANKTALLDEVGDAWGVNGNWNQGPGEGIDLNGAGSYMHNTFVIGSYNAKLTVGARIFVGQEGDKGFPEMKVVVVVDGEEHVIRATDAEADTVVVNSDNVTAFNYDLSQFAGKQVEIRIVCEKEVYHCVVANVSMQSAQA